MTRRDLQSFISRTALVIALGCPLLGLSSPSFALDEGGFGLRILADSYTDRSGAVASGLSRIVFYRPVGSSTSNAATIYVNHMYHASLVAGGYSPICLRPGMTEVGVREMKVAEGPKDGQDSEMPLTTRSGATQYVRVRESGQHLWSLETVPARQAEEELSVTRLQVHTLSRVIGAQKCEASDKGQIELVGDDLFRFKFARSDRGGLTGQGAEALDSVLEVLESHYSRLDQVTVVGYADPLGDSARNEQLSEERAQTVLQYLEANGLHAATLQAEGRGSQDLVVENCPQTVSAQSIACNQPNRRVVIEVSGQRK